MCSVYAHVRVHVCVSLCTRMCVNEGVCLYVWVYVSICEIVHVRLFVYDCALVFCVCVCVCGCICVCLHAAGVCLFVRDCLKIIKFMNENFIL